MVRDTTRSSARGHTATQGHDTAGPGLRHGQARLVTRLGQVCDTAQCARSVRAGRARVCTWCTRLSLDSVNYSESLFGTLFMSTVHEVFKKIKNKIKYFKNKIK